MSFTDRAAREAAFEYRQERAVERKAAADELFREYATAIVIAQASHDPDDWLKAGSIFKQYAAAAEAAEHREG